MPCGYCVPNWWAARQRVSRPAVWSESCVVQLCRLMRLMFVWWLDRGESTLMSAVIFIFGEPWRKVWRMGCWVAFLNQDKYADGRLCSWNLFWMVGCNGGKIDGVWRSLTMLLCSVEVIMFEWIIGRVPLLSWVLNEILIAASIKILIAASSKIDRLWNNID